MTLDPTQLVTLALAALGAFGTGAKVVEKVAPKWIEWRKRRDKVEAEQVKAEREASGAHVTAWVDAERRCGELEAAVARLEERQKVSDRQIADLIKDLGRAMAKIETQSDEIRVLRERNIELTRDLKTLRDRNAELTARLQEVGARTESQPPLTRIG